MLPSLEAGQDIPEVGIDSISPKLMIGKTDATVTRAGLLYDIHQVYDYHAFYYSPHADEGYKPNILIERN